MNITSWVACSALALPWVVGARHANALDVDPEALPKVACSDLTFSHEFLAEYPKAPAACVEARVYNGQRYAKFNGKVYITDPAYITVQLFNVSGDLLTAMSLKPSIHATLVVDGKREEFSELKVGDPVTFWVSEKRFSFYDTPGGKLEANGVPPH
jgi:hypothetical protein